MIGGFTSMVTVLWPRMVVDRYTSIEKPDWTLEPTRVPLPYAVSVQPAASSEGSPERPMTTTSWVLISPPGTAPDINPECRVETDFGVLSVDGEVARLPHPTRVGEVHHIEVGLERVSG